MLCSLEWDITLLELTAYLVSEMRNCLICIGVPPKVPPEVPPEVPPGVPSFAPPMHLQLLVGRGHQVRMWKTDTYAH
jgi:hypothetical protein